MVRKDIREGRQRRKGKSSAMAKLKALMTGELREKENLREKKREWEAFITNRRECLQQFTFTRDHREKLQAVQVGCRMGLDETERKVEECEAETAGLDEAAQRVAGEGMERRREEIAEIEAEIVERGGQIKRSSVEETVRRARWAAMRGKGGRGVFSE